MRPLLILLAGCALTRNSPPVIVHYYAPQLTTEAMAAPTSKPGARVRFGRIEASAHLRYAIAYRLSPVELELYDDDRWTDTPEAYVERSLEQALFSARPLQQATSGNVLTLDVDVLAFEELRETPAKGRVSLRFRLRDDRAVIASDTITVVRPARSGSLADVVAAIGVALDEATARIGDRVVEVTVAHPMQSDSPR